MRQMIARMDDELHARLKERAAAEGRSVNALVVAVLEAAVARESEPVGVRERARRSGQLVSPPPPARVPSREAVRRATRGAGSAVSKALTAERAAR